MIRPLLSSMLLSVLTASSLSFAQDAAPAAPAAEAAATDPVAEADQLMKKRGVKNMKKAAELYKSALDKDPTNVDLMLKRADALNGVMRARTNGNALLFDGLSDSEKHKKIWRQDAPEALALAEKVVKARPKSKKARTVVADAYLYHSSSFGIFKAIIEGAADRYKKNAKDIMKLDKRYDDATGLVFMASFYSGAPWPMRDDDDAIEWVNKALKLKKSKRNLYYAGVIHHRAEKYKEALAFYEQAVPMTCKLPSDRDWCRFMNKELKRAIADAKKNID